MITTKHFELENGVCTILPGVRNVPGACFKDCAKDITRLCIPRSLQTIRQEAFEACENLVEFEVDKENKVFRIKDGCLCTAGGALLRVPANLEGDVTTPKGIKTIAPYAFPFYGYPYINTLAPTSFHLTVRNGVKEIQDHAFYGCNALKSIVLPDSLRAIGEKALAGTGLSGVLVIPEHVEKVGTEGVPFKLTVDLQSKKLYSFCDIDYHRNEDERAMKVIMNRLDGGGEPPILIPRYVHCTCFDRYHMFFAALGFARLYVAGEELDEEQKESYITFIRNNRKKLYPAAAKFPALFHVMTAERLITGGDVETVLALTTQAQKTDLTAELLEYQEKHCRRVDPIKKMEREMEKAAAEQEKFAEMGTLTVKAAKERWTFGKASRDKETLKLISWRGTERDVIIPKQIGEKKVTEIGEQAFSILRNLPQKNYNAVLAARKKIRSIQFHDGIVSIGYRAFMGCEKLESFVCPPKVKDIGDSIFEGCKSLASVTLHEGMEWIYLNAFDGCTSLKTLVIPKTKVAKLNFYFAFTPVVSRLTDLTILAEEVLFLNIETSLREKFPDLTLHAPAGGGVEKFAKEHFLRFEAIEKGS